MGCLTALMIATHRALSLQGRLAAYAAGTVSFLSAAWTLMLDHEDRAFIKSLLEAKIRPTPAV